MRTPTQDMSSAQRHNMLFELLRQEIISDSTTRRLSAKEKRELEAREAQTFMAAAHASWTRPPFGADALDRATLSAPESRSDHEFFRAVRA